MLCMKLDIEKVLDLCREEAPKKRCYNCCCTEQECALCFTAAMIETYELTESALFD